MNLIKSTKIFLSCGLFSLFFSTSVYCEQVRGLGTHNGNTEYSEYKLLEATEAKVTNSTCMGEYHPILPTTEVLNTNIYSAEDFSPQTKDNDWIIIDHVGSKDSAFNGERHIARRDTSTGYGLQWFGYEVDPNNDAIFKNVGNWSRLNVQQCPIRADWHTINGSGIIFNMSNTGNPGEYKAVYNKEYEGNTNTMSFYAYVVTADAVQLRRYTSITYASFSNGSATYEVLQSIPKECNSQSLSIEKIDNVYKFYIGNKMIFEPQMLEQYGTYAGMMVDYQKHNCTSLSSVYMFNFSIDGVNLFEGQTQTEDQSQTQSIPNISDTSS